MSSSDELAVRLCPLVCLQKHVAKLASRHGVIVNRNRSQSITAF